MCKIQNLIGLAAVSCALFSCTESEVTDHSEVNEHPAVASEWIKVNMGVGVEKGTSGEEGTESRTPAAVDETDRPDSQYMLDYLGMISVSPLTQPTAQDASAQRVIDINYGPKSTYREVQFNADNEFEVYFQVTEDEKQYEGASVNGTLKISDSASGTDPLEVRLTLVDKDKIGSHIPLYDFYYSSESTAPLGDSFYYLSYNPEVQTTGTTDFKPELPQLTREDVHMSESIWQTVTGGQPLYDEYGDRLFQSDQLIAIADEEYIYFYDVLLVNGENGGYNLLSKLKRDNSNNLTELSLKRLTTIVNASFILIDNQVWDESSYLAMVGGRVDQAQSEQKFKERFGIDVSDMTCPYATMDGINRVYDIIDRVSGDNTDEPVRLLLWADGYDTPAPDGRGYGKRGEYSFDKSFQLQEGVARGIGIAGKSYSVVFKGNADDNRYQNVCFYVNVDGVNIKIKAYSQNGFAFEQNKTHNVIVMVNAKDFADTVKSYKASSSSLSRAEAGKYIELEVPAENVRME